MPRSKGCLHLHRGQGALAHTDRYRWAWTILGQPDRAQSIFDAMADYARAKDGAGPPSSHS
jgi:hypothetical protein